MIWKMKITIIIVVEIIAFNIKKIMGINFHNIIKDIQIIIKVKSHTNNNNKITNKFNLSDLN